MGNGVSITQSKYRAEETFDDFYYVESLCKKQYFASHNEEFDSTLRSAIKSHQIDILELLLSVTRIKTIQPIHIAATYASLESLEILISAGFNVSQKDSKGRTPLHCVCERTKFTSDATLCISLLCHHAPKTMSIQDNSGSTPLHLAVKSNQVEVVKTLLQLGASFTIPNSQGKSSRTLAQELQFHNIVAAIDEFRNKATKSVTAPAPVDPERIMLIWGKFFENCMKTSFLNEDDDNDNDDDGNEKEQYNDYSDDGKVPDHISTSRKKVKEAHYNGYEDYTQHNESSYDNDYDNETNNHYDNGYGNMNANRSLIDAAGGECNGQTDYDYNYNSTNTYHDVDDSVMEWFSWILTSTSIATSTSTYDYKTEEYETINTTEYIVINKITNISNWLNDFLIYTTELNICTNIDKYNNNLILPTSLYDVIEYGWMSYFDESLNQSYWIHLATGRIEYYLPIGYDENIYHVELQPYENDSEWILADHSPCFMWTVTLCAKEEQYDNNNYTTNNNNTVSESKYSFHKNDDKYTEEDDAKDADEHHHHQQQQQDSNGGGNGGSDWYYYNRLTGSSTWEQPGGWETIVESNGGWTLCCQEGVEGYYWWHEASGAVAEA